EVGLPSAAPVMIDVQDNAIAPPSPSDEEEASGSLQLAPAAEEPVIPDMENPLPTPSDEDKARGYIRIDLATEEPIIEDMENPQSMSLSEFFAVELNRKQLPTVNELFDRLFQLNNLPKEIDKDMLRKRFQRFFECYQKEMQRITAGAAVTRENLEETLQE